MTSISDERWQGTLNHFTAYNMHQQYWNQQKPKRFSEDEQRKYLNWENRVLSNNYIHQYVNKPGTQYYESNYWRKCYAPYIARQEYNIVTSHRESAFTDRRQFSPPKLASIKSPVKKIHSPKQIEKRTQNTEAQKEKVGSKRKMYNFTVDEVNKSLYGYMGDEKMSKNLRHSISEIIASDIKEDDIKEFKEDLPPSLTIDILKLRDITHVGVFAKTQIGKGTRFGPFKGSDTVFEKDEPKHKFSWEVFDEDNSFKIVDATKQNQNWMKFIKPARFKGEQNVSMNQVENELYFDVTEDIAAGKELLVWYGNQTEWFSKVKSPTQFKEIEDKQPCEIIDAESGSFPCKRCGKIFSYEYYRDKHLKYTRCVDMGDRKFPCHLCQRSFEKKDRLRIHILHVHQKYRPHVCKVCGKRFSQSSSLNKHTRVHTGERPYQCPHCPKSFTASSILRTHLRQHNGERPFKCKFCSKAFASHAAHDSHVRRTHEQLKKYICKLCKKSFSMEFELTFHMGTHTTEELNSIHPNSNDSYEDYDFGHMSDDAIVVD